MSFEQTQHAEAPVVIEAKGLGKCYQIYERPSHRLLQGLVGRSRKLYGEFWALRGVDLCIRRGETVGIIGRNGSGKSTLLQLIAGTLAPTEGVVQVHGRVAALLELGSGFNPEFTGRENVQFNAALLGLTKEQVAQRLDAIFAFADIGSFVDQPLRNYSSGMIMRLAFSVMAHVDADILIIDEALAVGDAFFTQKCMRFLRDFQKRGTLLFVSHDDGAVTGLCETALWLDGGRLQSTGTAKEVVHAYLESVINARQDGTVRKIQQEVAPEQRVYHDARREWINGSKLRNDIGVVPFDPAAQGFGEMRARVTDVVLRDSSGNALSWVVGGERAFLEITVVADETLASPIVGFYLKDRLGQQLFGDNTWLSTLGSERRIEAGAAFRARFEFQMPRLRAGDYFLTIGVADGTKDDHAIQHWLHEALLLKSQAEEWATGLIGIPMLDIKLEKVE